MKKNNQTQVNQRRTFLKQFATGAAVLGTGILSAPLQLAAADIYSPDASDADAWFNKLKGKHKIVFDVTEPHEIFPFAWPKVFLMTNGITGTPEKEWLSGLLPGIQPVPSGVWAVGRAQEHGCAYCFVA